MTAPLLELKHVTVMRGERAALDDVSLTIGAGEHVCILGPNGCGKSTLIKTITRECYPLAREGSSIRILGRELWNVFELRNLLGIVSPDLLAQCSTDATGRDVVLSGFFSSTRIFPHHQPEPEWLARAASAMERLGIAHLAGRAVARMSSGEAKRTLIARALVHEPQALLFDEPSNALDLSAQFQLRDTMRALARGTSAHSSVDLGALQETRECHSEAAFSPKNPLLPSAFIAETSPAESSAACHSEPAPFAGEESVSEATSAQPSGVDAPGRPNRGLGILLVTHHVSEIIPEIERVVLLRAGRILADGPKDQILTAANLSNLFGVPVQLSRSDGYFQAW